MQSDHDRPAIRGSVIVAREGDVLSCKLAVDVADTARVFWTLHRGDFHPRRASTPVAGGKEWRVDLPDMTNGFAVRAEVDGSLYQSGWVQHFSRDSVRRYNEWRRTREIDRGEEPTRIPLFQYEYPFENLAFVCHNGDVPLDRLASLAEASDLSLEHHRGVHWKSLSVMSRSGSTVDANGTRYVFSGVTRDAHQLIFGSEDVAKNVPDVRSLRDSVGEYHLLSWDDDQIAFEHDYIGQGHLFHYASGPVYVAANGLHLLALVLRSLGVELDLDLPVVKAKFFSTSYPFEFQHGPRTDFAQVSRVSVYERIEIDSGGPKSSRTQLWSDGMDGDFSEERYEELLTQAASDIIDNVRIAITHPRFDNIVVDLSAGLDSRIVYSALTNLDVPDKVRIATRKGPEEQIAAAINNVHGFQWNDLPRTYSYPVAEYDGELPATSHSVFMDGYYIDPMFRPRENYVRPTLLLTGHGGEAFSRVMSVAGYFARDFKGDLPEAYENVDEVLRDVLRYIGNHQVWFSAGEDYFAEILCGSLDATPSGGFAKKFEDLYVSERNPFVCGSVFRGAMTTPQWRPLHSKALFRLRSLWFQHHQDYRLQFDLIRTLNPLVSEFPYIKPVEVARKKEFEKYRAPIDASKPIDSDVSTESVLMARARAESESSWLPTRDDFDATRAAVRQYERSAESFLDPLGTILDHAPELQDMGLPVFTYVERVMNRTNPRGFPKRHNIRNKLHIIMQEVLLIKDHDLGSS